MSLHVQDSVHHDSNIQGATVTIRIDGNHDNLRSGTTTDGGNYITDGLCGHTTYIVTITKDRVQQNLHLAVHRLPYLYRDYRSWASLSTCQLLASNPSPSRGEGFWFPELSSSSHQSGRIFALMLTTVLKGKRILLGVTGSIAAIKSHLIVAELVNRGAEVTAALTDNALQFTTLEVIGASTSHPIICSGGPGVPTNSSDANTWHVHLARSADAMVDRTVLSDNHWQAPGRYIR